MTRIDSFGRDVPTTNLGGNPEVNTVCGGVLTLVIVTVTLLYASIKLTELVKNKNPRISDVTVPEYISNTEYVSVDEMDFKMAFKVFEANPTQGSPTKYDPRYVKLYVFDADWDYVNYDSTDPKAVENVKQLSYHQCTEEDLSEFHPIREQDKATVERYIDDFICLDEPERPLAFNTGFGYAKGRSLYFILYPCHQTNLYWFDNPDPIHEECIADEEL